MKKYLVIGTAALALTGLGVSQASASYYLTTSEAKTFAKKVFRSYDSSGEPTSTRITGTYRMSGSRVDFTFSTIGYYTSCSGKLMIKAKGGMLKSHPFGVNCY